MERASCCWRRCSQRQLPGDKHTTLLYLFIKEKSSNVFLPGKYLWHDTWNMQPRGLYKYLCMYVCPLFFLTTFHPIYFTLVCCEGLKEVQCRMRAHEIYRTYLEVVCCVDSVYCIERGLVLTLTLPVWWVIPVSNKTTFTCKLKQNKHLTQLLSYVSVKIMVWPEIITFVVCEPKYVPIDFGSQKGHEHQSCGYTFCRCLTNPFARFLPNRRTLKRNAFVIHSKK